LNLRHELPGARLTDVRKNTFTGGANGQGVGL